jgi:hypothetical protein
MALKKIDRALMFSFALSSWPFWWGLESSRFSVFNMENLICLLAPLDADGKFCGLDPGYESHPYLYFLDLDPTGDLLSSAVCVSGCPANNTDPIDCKTTSVETDCNKYVYPLRYDSTLGKN